MIPCQFTIFVEISPSVIILEVGTENYVRRPENKTQRM